MGIALTDVRLGVKSDAVNVGGLNIFGEQFGNYPQPIVLKVNFVHPRDYGNSHSLDLHE